VISTTPRPKKRSQTPCSTSSPATSPSSRGRPSSIPVIGRESEIERVIQILARRTKNNPVLIGEPGVGKTAIVEGPRAEDLHPRRPRTSS
jgi:ATP-dependent Clp protease ATP-binding subunit ClpC